MSGAAHTDVDLAAREAFGLRLWRLMDERGWNQSELARRSGLHRHDVSKYVNGYAMPSMITLMRLRAGLGCTWEELMGE